MRKRKSGFTDDLNYLEYLGLSNGPEIASADDEEFLGDEIKNRTPYEEYESQVLKKESSEKNQEINSS